MSCPKCHHNGSCLNSRRKTDGSVSRTYKCLSKKCDWRWSSTEVIVNQGTLKQRMKRRHVGGQLSLAGAKDRRRTRELIQDLAKGALLKL